MQEDDVSLVVREVRNARDLHRFVTFPWEVYRNDPNWVPPLISQEKNLLTPGKHPFHEHGEIRCFLAEARHTGGRQVVVGRIAAIRNRRHEEFHGEPVGFFGFFECLPTKEHFRDKGLASLGPEEVTAALLDAARDWVRRQGLEILRGPMNPSTNETCALLVDGFDDPPMVMMPYNPPQYVELLEGAGLRKAKDLVAYTLEDADPPPRMVEMAEKVSRRTGVRIRPLRKKELTDEVRRVQEVYNSAWEKNWGFVPMTPAELDHMAKELKPIVEPRLVCFAEKGDRTVGFALALPDVNQALKHANGRLFPFGLIKVLWYSRRIDRMRVLALGLLEEFRGLGIDQLMYLHLWREGRAMGMRQGEFSWILEDNMRMRVPLERFGARVYKTYRIYDMAT
jgi:GNAT superfamily N-acetyltransferase